MSLKKTTGEFFSSVTPSSDITGSEVDEAIPPISLGLEIHGQIEEVEPWIVFWLNNSSEKKGLTNLQKKQHKCNFNLKIKHGQQIAQKPFLGKLGAQLLNIWVNWSFEKRHLLQPTNESSKPDIMTSLSSSSPERRNKLKGFILVAVINNIWCPMAIVKSWLLMLIIDVVNVECWIMNVKFWWCCCCCLRMSGISLGYTSLAQ